MTLYGFVSATIYGLGMWLSLVERCVRDAKVAGSNPVIPTKHGGIAQMGERLNGIQEASGSIPLISTIQKNRKDYLAVFLYYFLYTLKNGKPKKTGKKCLTSGFNLKVSHINYPYKLSQNFDTKHLIM